MEIYKQYRQDHNELPIKILGANAAGGGELMDPAIVGFLDDASYFRTAAEARVSVYHGMSRFHVHYHPIEFMALGVPVLFHLESVFAAEGQHYGLTMSQLKDAGMYTSIAEANAMAKAALNDASVAEHWSVKQRFFLDEVFNRKKVLDQARWIKRRVEQLSPWLDQGWLANLQSPSCASSESTIRVTPAETEVVRIRPKRPIHQRVVRELKRLVRKAMGLDAHLQHMAVDVHVLAERYHSLLSTTQLTQTSLTALKDKVCDRHDKAIETHEAVPNRRKFYGQFSPPVDKFIFERYFPSTGIKGVFVECGAFDGQLECSCKFFEESMGWTGYNLEPSPHVFENLSRNRPNSRNINLALSNHIGTASFKMVKHPQLGLNYGNGSLSHTDEHTQLLEAAGCTFVDVDVQLTTWRALVEQEGIVAVDLMVLDVEGHELSVLEGMHGCSVLPDVICVEVGHVPLSTVRLRLSELGYLYDISSHVNAFFILQNKLPVISFRQLNKSQSIDPDKD